MCSAFELEQVDWDLCAMKASRSKVIEACDLWNQGMGRLEIADTLKLSPNTIGHYLCDMSHTDYLKNYSSIESMKRSQQYRSQERKNA